MARVSRIGTVVGTTIMHRASDGAIRMSITMLRNHVMVMAIVGERVLTVLLVCVLNLERVA